MVAAHSKLVNVVLRWCPSGLPITARPSSNRRHWAHDQWDSRGIGSFTYSLPGQPIFRGPLAVTGPVTIPEPASLALVGVSLLGMAFIKRRKGMADAQQLFRAGLTIT
jgi:hypothetical protein